MSPRKRLPLKGNPQKRMKLLDHFRELRNRAIVAAVALLIASVLGWFLYDSVLGLLQKPLDDIAAADDKTAMLNFAGVVSPFDMKIKISIFIGIILSAPVWLYEIWAFIMPGLHRKEKLYTIGFLGTALPLFLAGGALAFFALPNAVRTMGGLVPQGTSYIVPAQDYLSFVTVVIIAFGAAFVLPVLMVGLNMLDLLSARTIRRSWRWLVVLVFVFAAIATPTPDAVSMFYLVIPMLFMFFLAWLICAIIDRGRKKRRIADGTWVEPID